MTDKKKSMTDAQDRLVQSGRTSYDDTPTNPPRSGNERKIAKRKKVTMQPVVHAVDGVIRFQSNRLVEALYESSKNNGVAMNEMVLMVANGKATRAEYEQLAQLLGYSVSGFGDIRLARKKTIAEADRRASKLRDRAR